MTGILASFHERREYTVVVKVLLYADLSASL
jgi:hypothetical protein